MENESGDFARGQLSQLQSAVDSTVAEALRPAPLWFWPCFAVLGPAIVAGSVYWEDSTLSGDRRLLLLLATIAFVSIALVAMVVGLRQELSNSRVRLKAPARGGPTSVWNFLMVLSITLGMMVTGNIAPSSNPTAVAIVSFLWLTFAPPFFAARHRNHLLADT